MAVSHHDGQRALKDAACQAVLYLWNTYAPMGNAEITSAAIRAVLPSIRKAISTRLRFSKHLKTGLENMPLNALRRVLEHAALMDRIALSQTSDSLRQHCLQITSAWSTLALHEDANICHDRHRSGLLPYYIVGSHRHSPPAPSAALKGLSPLLRLNPTQSQQLYLSVELCPLLVPLVQDVIGRTIDISMHVFAWCQVKQRQFSWDHYVEGSVWIPDRPWNVLLEKFVDALRLPAPHLRSLSLTIMQGTIYTPVFETLSLPITFLGGNAGQLRFCRVGGISLQPVAYPAFSLLRVLEYAPIPENLRASELDCVLESMGQLESLGLTVASFENDSRPGSHYCARLRRVGFTLRDPVRGSTRALARELLRRNMSNIVDFCVARNVGEIAVSRQCPHTLEWSAFPSFPAAIEEGPEVVLARYESYIILHPPTDRTADVFHNLTSLTIWTCFLRLPSLPPSAPALRSLRVLCLSCQKCAESDGIDEGIWMSSWHVPSLRTLHVTGLGFCQGIAASESETRYSCKVPASAPVEISTSSVLQLLAVLRSQGGLASLTISSVRLVCDRPRNVLDTYADKVVIVDQRPDAELLRVLEMRSKSGWATPTQIFEPEFRPGDWAWAELRSQRASKNSEYS